MFGSGTWDQFDETGSNEIDQDAWLTVMGWYGRRKKSIAEIEVQKVMKTAVPLEFKVLHRLTGKIGLLG